MKIFKRKNLDILDLEIEKVKALLNKKIGIVGTRATGKTAFLTMLISTAAQKDYTISVAEENENNIKQIKQEDIDNYYMNLKEHGTIGPSSSNWRIRLRISKDGSHHYINTFDPTGEAYNQIRDQGNERFYKEVRDLLKESFGIIFVMDYPTAHRKEIMGDNSIYSAKLLTEKIFSFDEKQNKHELEDSPIAIVLSKVDKMSEFNYENTNKNLEEEVEKIFKLQNGEYNEEYNRIKNQIGENNLKIFPTTIGYHLKETKKKDWNLWELVQKDDIITQIKPYGIIEPFDYVLKKRNDYFLREMKTLFNKKNKDILKNENALDLIELFYKSVFIEAFEDFYKHLLNLHKKSIKSLRIIQNLMKELEGVNNG